MKNEVAKTSTIVHDKGQTVSTPTRSGPLDVHVTSNLKEGINREMMSVPLDVIMTSNSK